ncbi:hypothetical protein L3Y34_011983 [Caenorhabditis briggsae]|uniref:Uncharacterized protein n=1 Tax=Caenorhabditis briggsae TaxID=6238 RepID=A0AAE8ZQ75_CAEBR|nr:hypothetical protein L3Y34_011983 [Caenorhabditis briggsae]
MTSISVVLLTSNIQTDSMCGICLCEQMIPTRIDDCGHSFCFLCLKSVPVRKCRYDVDIRLECTPEMAAEVFSDIKRQEDNTFGSTIFKIKNPGNRKFFWIYEARGSGWYRYDPRTELVLEDCYRKNKKSCEVEICGKKFTIDIGKKTQTRGELHSEKRCIQRIETEDIYRYNVKGIAGNQCHFFPITNLPYTSQIRLCCNELRALQTTDQERNIFQQTVPMRGSTPAVVELVQDPQVEVEAVEVAHENISIDLARIVFFYSFIILVAYFIWSRVMDQVLDVMVKYQPRSRKKRIEFLPDELI